MKKIKNGHAFRQTGFTLFELLITISIIAIITAIATVSYSNAQKKGRDARRMQDMKNIQTAAEQYYLMNNSVYPPVGTVAAFSSGLISGGFLQAWPVDPKNVTPYTVTGGFVVGVPDYCVCAQLENTTAGNSINASCNFTGVGNKTHYCVKNQQ
ncbi:MAG: prepilin-type N-terminal cleavage/methylation domain-containing protein [Candidatus Shapirobacteria bacterium]|jgi:prepilin-type N-terminal cleavage/methylation domain-containing protein